uniref:Reverse transcriptase Ty1/copia-type domain-containing protein n=1 Tax=Nicotiana tabacum TaxID=4097 RepID=A0A1S4C1E4_TOBAC|nr:PREDICTED: uncharacterized protein LOC107814141 [Nicotiana tabacum]
MENTELHANIPSNFDGFTAFTLDPSHPLYIHPSDSLGVQLVTVPFNGTSFVIWRSSMLTSLSTKNKVGLITGKVAQPALDSPYFPFWERCNNMVKAWITNSLIREIAISVMCLSTAKEVWMDINERFGQSNGSKYIQFQREISSTFQGSSDIVTYFTKIRTKSSIFMMSLYPSISKAYSLLQEDESQKETHPVSPRFSTDSASFSVPSTQLHPNKQYTQRVTFESKKPSASATVSCKYYKKSGHTIEKCYRLHGFPPDFKFAKNKRSASCVQMEKSSYSPAVFKTSEAPVHGFNKEQYNHLMALLQQTHISPNYTPASAAADRGGYAHFASVSYLPVEKMHSLAHSLSASFNSVRKPWILDSDIPASSYPILSSSPTHGFTSEPTPYFTPPTISPPSPSISPIFSFPSTSSPLPVPSSPLLRKSTIVHQPPAHLAYYFYQQAVSHPVWQHAMLQEFKALEANNTWDIIPLPLNKKPIPCKWVYKIKQKSDGTVERYKARLVIMRDTQKEGIDYFETFSPVVKFTTIKCLLSLAAKKGWNVHQLDVNNDFLYGDLHEEVYMKVPLGLSVSGPSSSDSSSPLYVSSSLTVLAVYVDNILLAGDHITELDSLKTFLDAQFKIKDLGEVHYFLGLEVSSHPEGFLMCQHKFTSELLAEFNCTHFTPVVTPLDPSIKLISDMGAPISDPSTFRRLVGKLNFLQRTRPDIGILLSKNTDLSLVAFSDYDWAACAQSRSKKQPTISLSSAEAEYRALRKVVVEVSWLIRVLVDLGLTLSSPVPIFCDSQAALHIAKNPVFHERTKYIEIDCHFVRDCLASGLISLHHVFSSTNLADILTKPLPGPAHHNLLCKLGVLPLRA